nr:hypothetical protein [Eubacterium sp.]
MERNTAEIENNNSEIVGVMIEGKYATSCGGTEDKKICISDYFNPEREQEIRAAEVIEENEDVLEYIELEPDMDSEGEIIQIEMEMVHDEAYQFKKLFAGHKNMYPFEDDEMTTCVQIEPSDFSDFPKKYWQLGSNTFLLQGYYNYRHLILATNDEVIYVGIPGQYHRRDQYMADMFGFGRFKGIHKKECQLGDFGYWMLAIPKPQSTETWVDCGETS